MFEPGRPAIVAVSGGPDSLCLLHSIVRLERLLDVRPVCFHFDHRLREGSDDDARYVASQARRLGVPFVRRAARTGPARGASVEAWARTERYEALTALVEELGGGAAAVGHTADDQAETVLLALVRGGGLEAVSGMRAVSRPIVRPLLGVTREETVAFCRALRLRPREDPMNDDPSFLRVAIRTRLLPALEASVGRDVRAALVRSAELLEHDADLLEELASAAAIAIIVRREASSADLSAAALRATPAPLAGRVVRDVLYGLGVVPERAHVDAVVALASARPGAVTNLPGGLIGQRTREYVALSRPSPGGPSLPQVRRRGHPRA